MTDMDIAPESLLKVVRFWFYFIIAITLEGLRVSRRINIGLISQSKITSAATIGEVQLQVNIEESVWH